MTLPLFPQGETVTLHRRVPQEIAGEVQRDAYGVIIYDEVDEVVTGLAIWPESSTEFDQNQHRTNQVYVGVVQAAVEIDSIVALTLRGKRWEIQGETEFYATPLGGQTGTYNGQLKKFRMNRVEG